VASSEKRFRANEGAEDRPYCSRREGLHGRGCRRHARRSSRGGL